MLTYKEHFESKRHDGRNVCTMAAQMESFRNMKQKLALPDELTPETFKEWQEKVREKQIELLCMPEFTEQPAPVMLSCVQREGYRVEKWELYPDDYTAVPFLALIPDGADSEHPVPAVLCLPGSNHSKEFLAGEPQIDHPNGACTDWKERNQMAKYMVENGMAAFVFDNPGTGETAVMTDPASGETLWNTRVQFTHGYLDMGMNYLGVSVFQKLCFMEHLKTLDYVDQDRIALSSHSLGTEVAGVMGVICDNIKAVVFNEFLHNDLRRYVAITEQDERNMIQNIGNWHIVPGRLRWFGFPEQCAAMAPCPLIITEGGPDEFINLVRRGYEAAGAPENFEVSYYPEFADPESRTVHDNIPDKGLSRIEYYKHYSYCVEGDHSFRRDPAIAFLKKHFGMKD